MHFVKHMLEAAALIVGGIGVIVGYVLHSITHRIGRRRNKTA